MHSPLHIRDSVAIPFRLYYNQDRGSPAEPFSDFPNDPIMIHTRLRALDFCLVFLTLPLSFSTSTASISGRSGYDDTGPGLRSDSAVRVAVSDSNPTVGNTITVDLILDNTSTAGGGPFDIFTVVTTLTLPTSFTIDEITPGFLASCSSEASTLTCTHISFPAGSTETSSVTVTVTESGEFTITRNT